MRDPAEMSPEERFREVAGILARGILRSRGRNPPGKDVDARSGSTGAPGIGAPTSRPSGPTFRGRRHRSALPPPAGVGASKPDSPLDVSVDQRVHRSAG
jgi:hypothetical protein